MSQAMPHHTDPLVQPTAEVRAGLDAPSSATVAARAKLEAAALRRPQVSERTLDRLRVRWELCALEDAGVVVHWERHGGVGTYVDAVGFKGTRCYRTTRELEAFVHGAQAGHHRRVGGTT